jgi:hypothetical protein
MTPSGEEGPTLTRGTRGVKEDRDNDPPPVSPWRNRLRPATVGGSA